MKKQILILVLLLAAATCLAHEFSYSYKLYGDKDSEGEQSRGWVFNFANLSWGDNDFSDYALSINFTDLDYYFKPDIVKTWIKIPIIDNMALIVGKDNYLFGAKADNGSC